MPLVTRWAQYCPCLAKIRPLLCLLLLFAVSSRLTAVHAFRTVLRDLQTPQFLALDHEADRIYWTEAESGTLSRAYLNGSGQELLWNSTAYLASLGRLPDDETVGRETPIGVAIDPTQSKVYWTTDCCSVWRADLNGSNTEALAQARDAAGIALDLDTQKMYWTVPTNGTIWRANLDGSEAEIVFFSPDGSPTDVAMGSLPRHIYWSDSTRRTITHGNLDDRSEEVVVNISHLLGEIHGLAVDTQRNHAYLTGSFPDGMNDTASPSFGGVYRAGLDIDHPDIQPIVFSGAGEVPFGIVYEMDTFSLTWTDRKAGAIDRLSLRCAPGSIKVPSAKNHSLAEVTYGPLNHGVQKAIPCPTGYGGQVTLECSDGHVGLVYGTCSRQCDAGSYLDANGTNVTHGLMNDGETVTSGCENGLVGPVVLRCTDGHVSIESGKCQVPSGCEAGGKLLFDALIKYGSLPHGATEEVGCPTGFNGSYVLGCRNGVVYPVRGICRSTCSAGSLWLDSDGGPFEVRHPDLVPDQKVQLPCPEGYAGNGIALQCVNQSINIQPEANCVKVRQCEEGVSYINGAIVPHGRTEDGQKLTVRCPAGYSGSVDFGCSDGDLLLEGGTCKEDCVAATILDANNVSVNVESATDGKVVVARCPTGYQGLIPARCEDGNFTVECSPERPRDCVCHRVQHPGSGGQSGHSDYSTGMTTARPNEGTDNTSGTSDSSSASVTPAIGEDTSSGFEVPLTLLLPIVAVIFFVSGALYFMRSAFKARDLRSCASMPSGSVSGTSSTTSTTPSSCSSLPPSLGGPAGSQLGSSAAAARRARPYGKQNLASNYLIERDGDPIADEAGVSSPIDPNQDMSLRRGITPLPSYWGTSDGVHITPDPNRINEVQRLMTETWRVCYTRDRMMVGGGTRVPVGCRVANVLRIENHRGYEKYFQYKEKVARRRSGDLETFDTTTDQKLNLLDDDSGEKYLFHGTNPESAHSIARKLFRIDLAGSSRGCMFGPGVYLAENASKSDEYAKEGNGVYVGLAAMLICRAVTGKVLRVESSGDFSEQVLSEEYDCVCGDRLAAAGTFREMVFFHEEAVYPEFIVIYARVYDS